jgi:hypothetical protein
MASPRLRRPSAPRGAVKLTGTVRQFKQFTPGGSQDGHTRQKTRPRTDAADWSECDDEQPDSQGGPAAEPAAEPDLRQRTESELVELLKGLAGMEDRIINNVEKSVAGMIATLQASLSGVQSRQDKLDGCMAALTKRMGKGEETVRSMQSAAAKGSEQLRKDMAEAQRAVTKLDKLVVDSVGRADEQADKLNGLMAEVAQLKRELASHTATAAPGGGAGDTDRPTGAVGGPGGAQPLLLQSKLREEGQEFGRTLKLVGFLGSQQGARGLELCEAAGQALSSLLGCTVRVERACWLRVPGGAAPKLLVVLSTMAMAQAVRGLRGAGSGRASKLAPDQRILEEYGPVEMAVRRVLFREKEQLSGSWVGRSALMVKHGEGKPHAQPLSAQAVAAGLVAMHEGKGARQAQASPARPAQPARKA